MKRIMIVIGALLPVVFACAASPEADLLVVRGARDLKRYSEHNSSQISYSLEMKYPAEAISVSAATELKKRGWAKCSGYREGWDSFVDGSAGEGRERTVFQNNSYWFKSDTLLTVSMRYYASVDKNKHPLRAPDNTSQHVVVLENKNPGVKEKLGLICP